MISIVVQAIIIIILSIGAGANFRANEDMLRFSPRILDSCPSLRAAEYQVMATDSVTTLNGGCVYINYDSSDIIKQSFNLRLGGLQKNSQRCRDQDGLEYFNFYCLTKSLLLTKDIIQGRMYMKLYYTSVKNPGEQDYKCALYETLNETTKTFRMAVSRNATCDGLLDMISHPQLTLNDFNNGSILLLFNMNEFDLLETSTRAEMTTTESLTSVAKQYQRWDNILPYFVKRPIFWVPFVKSSTQSSPIQISSKRVQRNALPYNSGGNGGRRTIMSYSLQSASNGNNNSTNTASLSEDRNGLRQPIEIDNMQIKRRRSVSNVKSSSKSDVIVLAGSNPFALILANRVHNNTTGSIKPIGLWEQIKRLF